MRRTPVILEEIGIWLRGRFTLTHEEKKWLLMILVICLTGLTARYFYLKTQPAEQTAEAAD